LRKIEEGAFYPLLLAKAVAYEICALGKGYGMGGFNALSSKDENNYKCG